MEKAKLPDHEPVLCTYDKEADVLYISFGQPKSSEVLDTGNNILLRFDINTGEITGFTILNFSEYEQDIEDIISRNMVRS